MTNLYKMYKTETDLEVNGVWQVEGDSRIKIARSGNKNTKYNKTFTKVTKKYDEATIKTLNNEKSDALMAEIFVKSVITAWESKDGKGKWVSGIVMPDDKGELSLLPFNLTNAKKCLLDLPDLFGKLRDKAGDLKTFQKEVEETQLKN